MFTLIGLIIGGFIGVVASGYLGEGVNGLSLTVRQTIDSGIRTGGTLLDNITRSMPYGSLINIGVVVVVFLLLIWMMSFTTALILGVLAGIVYKDQVGSLPFVSGLADTVRQKIDSSRGGSSSQ